MKASEARLVWDIPSCPAFLPDDECLIGYLAWVELGGLAFKLRHKL